MNAIELKKISKTYRGSDLPAVSDLSLILQKGEIVTLLGPSGCGKTTTLRLLAGFERADSGVIELGGNRIFDENRWIPPERRNIGMVFQDYALFPHLNVIDNIGFGYRGKDKKSRTHEVLELVSLKGYESRFPHELSGGQQQRVAIARALARRPVVVLLDEPFSNLDADLRICMRVEVKRIIKEAGATAVFVSHDQKDALAISDKIVVMKDGKVQQIGSPKEIYQFPVNSFVANFVGHTNIIKGVVGEDGRVITPFAEITCNNSTGLKTGTNVKLSVRPDSFQVEENGPIESVLLSKVYGGNTIDAVVGIQKGDFKQKISMQLHPSMDYEIGTMIKLGILPGFVSVLNEK
ncbi:ABC transporter ATP-binding protein [Alkalicella caledoniensis]|uniref:ABC-type quaternary amine transporter n=1 Tax=Alkalicella caledoniensis TaxID=2731377 RepID=A0A7G9W548_ALKCA|nr:ABC transporter ATP-binding protein [Alkalicella caledoniensis]QNO13810.1 ABC transporter ATP-binding protein [Alkalicella caledoniensis]